MTEDELLTGLLDAAAIGGFLVHHDRRSDLALTQGAVGFPDIIAVHPTRGVVVIECKSAIGRTTPEQDRWLEAFSMAGIKPWVVRPADYDATVEWLVGDKLLKRKRGAR